MVSRRHPVWAPNSLAPRLSSYPRTSAKSAARPFLATRHSSLATISNSFLCHTSAISPLTPFFATDPKTHSRKPFACHTCEPPWRPYKRTAERESPFRFSNFNFRISSFQNSEEALLLRGGRRLCRPSTVNAEVPDEQVHSVRQDFRQCVLS